MLPLTHLNQKIATAAALGLLALVVNLLSYTVSPDLSLPIGNVFLYWSAMALGSIGAALSLLIGVVFDVVWSGDYFYGVRIVTTVLLVGLATDRVPKLPSYLVVLLAWIAFIAPASFLVHPEVMISSTGILQGPFSSTAAQIGALFYAAFGDLLLVLVSGILLLNQSLWATLTNRLRPLSLSTVLMHFVTLVSTTALFGAYLSLRGPSTSNLLSAHSLSVSSAILLLCLAIVLPSAVVWLLSARLKDICQDLFPGTLMPNAKPHGFSGLSSEFWRRKGSIDYLPGMPAREDSRSSGVFGRSPAATASFTPDKGICVLDEKDVITFVNRRFATLVGLTDGNELLNKKLTEVNLAPNLKEHLRTLVERTRTKGPRSTELRVNQLPDKLRFFELASTRGDQLEGSSVASTPNSVVITVKDITDRRSVESHLLESQKLGSLGNVVSGLARSFEESLLRIESELEKAERSPSPDKIKESHSAIRAAAKEASTLVHQLIDFADGRPSRVHTESIASTVKDRLELIRKMVGDQITVEFYENSKNLPVDIDSNLVMQAITNLALNAKESYGSNPGSIQITIDSEEFDDDVEDVFPGAVAGSFARLRVRDFGSGMSPEVLSKAFDPLYTTKHSSGHTGLGLSIVFAIVRAHDGFLTVESKVEKGTTVSIYLPISKGDASQFPDRNTNGTKGVGSATDSGALIQ